VRGALHAAIAAQAGSTPTRRWWDAMRDENGGDVPDTTE
jgi:hypothetical protein